MNELGDRRRAGGMFSLPQATARAAAADSLALLGQRVHGLIDRAGPVSVVASDTSLLEGLGDLARYCDAVVCPVAGWAPADHGAVARLWAMRDHRLTQALGRLSLHPPAAGRVQVVPMDCPARLLVAVYLPDSGPEAGALASAYRAALGRAAGAGAACVLVPILGVQEGMASAARRRVARIGVAEAWELGAHLGLEVVLASPDRRAALAALAALAGRQRARAAALAPQDPCPPAP